MAEVNDLLIEIQKLTGYSYLSDLSGRDVLLNKQKKNTLLGTVSERYSLKAWNEAAAYITNENCNYSSIEEVINRITKN